MSFALAGCSTSTVHRNPVVRLNISTIWEDKSVIGSGFLINQKGHIITNDHVVHPWGGASTNVKVTLDPGNKTERTYTAKIVASDPTCDLAVIQLRGSWKKLPQLVIAHPSNALIGSSVKVQGYPNGGVYTETQGRITNILSPSEANILTGSILSDARALPGNSGGPLLSEDGRVLGVVVTGTFSEKVQKTKERMEIADDVARMARKALEEAERSLLEKQQSSGSHPAYATLHAPLNEGLGQVEEMHKGFRPFINLLRKYNRFSCSIPADTLIHKLNEWGISLHSEDNINNGH